MIKIKCGNKNFKAFNDEITKAIIERYLQPYGNMSIVAKEFKTCVERVKATLLYHGIKLKGLVDSRKRKKYTLNEQFFTNIETWSNNHAYFFGWLASDGHIGLNGEVSLRLQETDIDILEKFKKLIQYTGPFRYGKSRAGFANKKYISKPQYGLSMCSFHLAESLRSLGLDSRKTYNLRFPKWMPERLLSSFIKGYWEGDGCVTGKENIHIDFVGNKHFCTELNQIIKNEINVTTYLGFNNKNTYWIRISGTCQVVKFLNWIYKDDSLFLNRKYQKYVDLIKRLKYNPKIQNKTKEEIKKCKFYDTL